MHANTTIPAIRNYIQVRTQESGYIFTIIGTHGTYSCEILLRVPLATPGHWSSAALAMLMQQRCGVSYLGLKEGG